ncbi:MAG: 4-hydroxybenzoate 3-monooxygenase [Porticoccaceae bacterium]
MSSQGKVSIIKTQVCIIGAGPTGLLLGHLLHLYGIESILLEASTREKIESRVRAAVLDYNTVDILGRHGLSSRMEKEGVQHDGFELLFDGNLHRINVAEFTGGRGVTLYPQQELVKDLVAARLSWDGQIFFGVSDIGLFNINGNKPRVTFIKDGVKRDVICDFIVGCDGFHGVCRHAIPITERREYTREYPFAWLGILCDAPRSASELVYGVHERGFALISTRSPTIQRMYLQCDKNATTEQWPDQRIWEELNLRMQNADGWMIKQGNITMKNIVSMRSFVCENMHYGRLFLAGDAAHIVPPSAAKGLNLAVSDVAILLDAMTTFYRTRSFQKLVEYPEHALKRFWHAEHFSWWVTFLFHRFPETDYFRSQQQKSALYYLVNSRSAAHSFAENYVGIYPEYDNFIVSST